jgi:hypothetical protein
MLTLQKSMTHYWQNVYLLYLLSRQGRYVLFLEFNTERKDYKILEIYIPRDRNKKIKAKHSMFLQSSADESIFNYNDGLVDQQGGNFSYMRIKISFDIDVGRKFGSIWRLADMMPHIKTAKKFLLIAKNAIKVF